MIEGTFAIVAACLAFLVPLAAPLFVHGWRSFAIMVLIAGAILAWLWFDIEGSGGNHWLGTFLAGLMFAGFAFGAIAKFAMLLGRPKPDAGEPLD
jgi:hypothetical protein